MRYHFSRIQLLPLATLLALLVISLSATWLLASRPWRIDAVIGGADSAIVGTGFFTKELSSNGTPFRWTSGPAIINLPPVHARYLVTIRAYIPSDVIPYYVEIKDRAFPVATIVVTDQLPDFRRYHILWQSPATYHWLDLFTPRRFTIDAETRNRNQDDPRLLGIAVSHVSIRSSNTLTAPITPLITIGVTLLGFARLLWPLRGKRLVWFAVVALLLPVGYDLLVWHPLQGNDYTWLPCSWLPGMVAALTIGAFLAQSAARTHSGAFIAGMIVILLAFAVIATLQWHWYVEGPDYYWHLYHGGSWQRVFRAHPFYPFGFPLILWLGQLAGDQALLFGRIASAIATFMTIGATTLMVWRAIHRSYAWVASAVMLAAPVVVSHGVFASTDAPMVSFAALTLLALLWHEPLPWRQVILAGMALGLAYLFRVQTTMLLIPSLVWLYFQPMPQLPLRLAWLSRLGRLIGPLALLGGFLLVSAPQWLLDIRDTGLPFSTRQYVNIWSFAFERTDSVPEGSTFEQMWFILNFDPYGLWRHWLGNIRQFGEHTIHQLFIWPLGLVAFGGMIVKGPLSNRRYLLLLGWVMFYGLVVMLTTNKERFFLPMMPALALFITSFLAEMDHRLRRFGNPFAFGSLLISAILFYWVVINLTVAEIELATGGFTRHW
ncbi:glycosyltransferase family 39 protein [uncultured Chloroflexus sp.]|uniref:glycosyltransferase family 39 protein n=1 Tax=uncultured Chloroflexus sp. TaxID=214040 RepID=UPI002632467D|nr:glycosyltransferase family 39 protein [uncultured Chloroflexus sp.]